MQTPRPKFLSMAPALAAIFLILSTIQVLANPYDDCILQNMKGAQNKDAVYAIENACIGKASVKIPETISLINAKAKIGVFNSLYQHGKTLSLLIEFDNATGYSITEMQILVQDKKTKSIKKYIMDSFQAPAYDLATGWHATEIPEPASYRILPVGRTNDFLVDIPDAQQGDAFFNNNLLSVIALKGIPAN